MRLNRILAFAVASVLAIGILPAEEGYIELLRSDLRADKVALLTSALQLTDEEGTAFWPIYREYDVEMSGLADKRIALIKDYAENFTTMSEEKATELAGGFFHLREARIKVLKKYHKKVTSHVSAIRATQFVQIETQIANLIDVQIAGELPLMRSGKDIAND